MEDESSRVSSPSFEQNEKVSLLGSRREKGVNVSEDDDYVGNVSSGQSIPQRRPSRKFSLISSQQVTLPAPQFGERYRNSTKKDNEDGEEEETGFDFWSLSRRKKSLLIMNGFAFFFGGCGFSLLAPFFPTEAAKKEMSIALTSFVFSVFELMILITSPFFGAYLTFLGPKFVFMSGTFVGGVCTILFGTLSKCEPGAPFIVISILCRAMGAVGFSAEVTSIMAIISSELPKYVATCIALLATTYGIGLMVGPVIGGALYEIGGFGLPFYAIGGLVILSGIVIYIVMPDPEVIPEEQKVSRLLLLRNPMVMIPLLCIATGSIGLSFLDPTLASHLKPFDLRVAVIGLLFALPPFLFAISSPFLGYLSDKKKIYTYPIVIGHFIFGLGFLFIGPTMLLPFIPFQLWSVIVGLVFVGSTFGCSVVPTLKCMLIGAVELGFEENIDTYAVLAGVLNSTYSCGAFLGPMVGGVLVQNLGYSAAFTVIGMLSILMSIVSFIFFFTRYMKKSKDYQNLP